jgi:hypothetical protein
VGGSVNDETFMDLVRRLRAAQRHWFKYRDIESLERSKQLEREVDRWFEREAGPRAAPTLFDRKNV